jgi:hypothetical protein
MVLARTESCMKKVAKFKCWFANVFTLSYQVSKLWREKSKSAGGSASVRYGPVRLLHNKTYYIGTNMCTIGYKYVEGHTIGL